jgi:solute:Na+ symporter, SSS family
VTIWLRWTEPFSGTNPVVFAKTALATTAVTTLVWLVVTYMTKPEPQDVLLKFYRSVRPQITGWQPVARLAPEVPPTRDLASNLLSWILGCLMVYLALFGLGHVLIGPFWKGIGLLAASAICAGALYSNISRSWGAEVSS